MAGLFDDIVADKPRPKSGLFDDIVTPAAPPTPRGGTGDWWDKTKRLAGSVYGPVAGAAADVMKGVGLVGDAYANAQNAQAAATGYMTDPMGNRMLVPAAVRPELKRLSDQNVPTVSPLVNPVAARVAASGKAALPENPDLLEKGTQAVAGFAAPLATGPLAPLTFGAQAVGHTYDEAKAKGADEDTARRAAFGSGAVNTVLGAIPGEKVVAPFLRPVTKVLGESIGGRLAAGALERATGGAVVGGGMQTGENVVAQQTYDPTRPTTQGVGEAALSMAVAAPVMHAVLSTPGGIKAMRSWWVNRGGQPADMPPPEQLPPEALAELSHDPAVQAILQAQGIQPGATTPGGQNMADVVAGRLQARSVQARAGTIAQTASAARAEEQAANSALSVASTPEALAAAKARADQATAARVAADAELAKLSQAVGADQPTGRPPLPTTSTPEGRTVEAGIDTLRQGMRGATQNIPGDSGYVDPAALPVTDQPQPPGAFVVSPEGVAQPGEVQRSDYAPALERAGLAVPEKIVPTVTPTSTGAALRRPRNLPVVTEPQRQPMSDVEIAQAQRQAQPPPAQPETPARYVAPEGRQPQTPDQLAEQRAAAQAFALQERQRQRVEAGTRDVQPGVTTPEGAAPGDRQMGTEKGPQPQTVLLDEGFPVRVIERGPRGTVKVERYDPRTGQAEEGAEPYTTRQTALRQATYTPEPRRAQDFTGRANEPPTSPEKPRMAGGGQPVREPTQTYRTTEQDPNTEFPGAAPEGRSPFPPQPEGPGPFRDQPSGERAQRAWNEEDLRRQEERRQRENARDDQDRADSARARSRSGGAGKSTNEPRGQDEEGRWFTDEDGYVMSKGGGPIVFEDTKDLSAHKAAARWIIDEGQRKSPDQIFQRVAHPTKRQSTGGRFGGTKEAVSIIEVGRRAKTAEEEAQPPPGGAGEAPGAEGKAAPGAEPPPEGPARGLPGPEPAPRPEARAEPPPEPKSPEAQAASGRSPSHEVADTPLPKKQPGETLDQERERLHEAARILDARLRTAPNGEARKKARAQLDTVLERFKANDAERSKEKDAADPFKDHPEVAAAVKELRSAEKAYDRAKDHHDQGIANRAEQRLVRAERAEKAAREAAQKEAAPPEPEAAKPPGVDYSDEARAARKETRDAAKDAKFDKALNAEGPHGDDHEAAMRHLDVEMEKYANDKGQSIEAFDSPREAAKNAHKVLDPIYGAEGVENDVTFKVVRRQGKDGHIWRWEVIDYAPPDVRAGEAKTEAPAPEAKAEPAPAAEAKSRRKFARMDLRRS